jgi:hypothetical protein
MNSLVDIFLAVITMAWVVPDEHPGHGYLAMPEETVITMEVMAFEDAESCTGFISELEDGNLGRMFPVKDARLLKAECRPNM